MIVPQPRSTPVLATAFKVQHDSQRGPGSLAGARVRLTQYRAAAVEDMAHKAIRMEPEEFLCKFLRRTWVFDHDEPGPPQWDHNVFKGVEDAANMKEDVIAEKFVSVSAA